MWFISGEPRYSLLLDAVNWQMKVETENGNSEWQFGKHEGNQRESRKTFSTKKF